MQQNTVYYNLSTAQHDSGCIYPSLVAHNTVSTLSGINENCTSTCCERGAHDR